MAAMTKAEIITRIYEKVGFSKKDATDVVEAAFKLPQGAVSEPVTTDTGTAIVKVLEKQEVSPTDLTANKDTFREELLTDRRNRFFSSYMVKAKQKMKIDVNREAIQRVIG